MIILDSSNKYIEVLLGAPVTTNQLDWTSSYIALNTSCGPNCVPCEANIEQQGTTNDTTPVTMVFQPNPNTPINTYSNEVQFISVYNADTVNADVIIRINDGISPRIILSITIGASSTLIYNAESGWNISTVNGSTPTPLPFTIGSGLTLVGGTLNFGGSLSQNTLLDGFFDFNIGSVTRLNNFQVYSSNIALTADTMSIISANTGYAGIKYDSTTSAYVATNGNQYTIFDRGYNDLRYAPISVVGSVTSVSVVTANGISGSVANPTTTPAITLTLGAITPSSVNGNIFTTGTGTLTLSTYTVTAAGNATISGTNTGDQTITLTGDVTGSGTGTFATTLTNSAVTGQAITGYVSGAGTITATDTILTAIEKLNGNIGAILAPPFSDANTLVKNASDATKLIKFSAASISTGTTRTYTMPDVSTTVVGKTGTTAANYVSFWNDPNQITGSANFEFDNSTFFKVGNGTSSTFQIQNFGNSLFQISNRSGSGDYGNIYGNGQTEISVNSGGFGTAVAFIMGTRTTAPLALGYNNHVYFSMSTGGRIYFGDQGTVSGTNIAATAQIHISAGTATASTAPLKFTSGTNLTSAEAGAVEWNGTQMFLTSSVPTRNIMAQINGATALTSTWIPFATTSGYLTGSANLVYNGSNLIIGTNGTYGNSLLQLTGSGFSGINSRTGSGNFNNIYGNGQSEWFATSGNSGQIFGSTSTVPVGIGYNQHVYFNMNTGGRIYIGDQGTVSGSFTSATAQIHISAGTATASTAPLKFTAGTNLTSAEAGAVEWDGVNLFITQTSGPTRKTIAYTTDNSSLKYAHTIFTPTTGGTVNLVNNQYNIINPVGALLALTVNLPSSPVNNDVVFIKFTQNITTVTYANGTVVDGITAPTAGGLTVLVYDSGTTSWY